MDAEELMNMLSDITVMAAGAFTQVRRGWQLTEDGKNAIKKAYDLMRSVNPLDERPH